MKFEIKHRFDVSVEQLEHVLFHEKLPALLVERMETIIEVEPMSAERIGNKLKRRVRYLPKPIVPPIGVKKVEPEWMEWFEESVYDFGTHRGDFKNIPARGKIAKVLTNVGRLELKSASGGGSEQVISGELKVSVFMVGKIAERVIHSSAVKILNDQARVVAQIVASGELS